MHQVPRALLFLLPAALLAGCRAHVEPWAGPTGSTGPTEEVAIPALGVTLDVPTGTEVVHTSAGATFYTQPEARGGRSFSLELGEPSLVHPEAAVARQERKLPNGSRIRYEIRTADEGSGGPEAFLDGAIVVDQNVFAVHCHDQAEPPATPTAEWCLQWLATLDSAR